MGFGDLPQHRKIPRMTRPVQAPEHPTANWEDPLWVASFAAALTGFISRNHLNPHECITQAERMADWVIQAREKAKLAAVKEVIES